MQELARLLNEMCKNEIVTNYAIFEAVAQMRYTEPVATVDADVLVAMEGEVGLDVLKPIYEFCSRQGFQPKGKAIEVGAWPVQFIPVFSPLTKEAVEEAETADFEGIPLCVVRAVHLAVIALSVGRAKDFTRILALLDAGSVNQQDVANLAAKHGLANEWQRFERKFLND